MLDDLVICPYCQKHMKQITGHHLKSKHEKTTQQMKIEFPGIKNISDSVKEKTKETFIKKYGVDNPSKNSEIVSDILPDLKDGASVKTRV